MVKFEKVSLETFKKSLKVSQLKFVDFNDEDIDKLYSDIQIPERATKYSAGYDFRLPFNISLPANETILIPTGIKANMNDNNVLMIFPRSSLGMKYNFTLLNTTGIIDKDYYNNEKNEGHIMACFKVSKDIELQKGEKFMQGIFTFFDKVNDDTNSVVRVGGIGSTGK